MTRHLTLTFIALLSLSACGPKPSDSAFFNRGGPESLLDVSSEVVNLSVADPAALNELSSWVKSDQPTRAELYCAEGDMSCNEARRILDSQGIPTMNVPSGQQMVALVYERMLARDCKSRYVDDSHNFYGASHSAFGCANAANIVQSVSNKQQFVNPNLTDTAPATGGVATYQRLYTPRAQSVSQQQGYTVQDSLTKSAKQ